MTRNFSRSDYLDTISFLMATMMYIISIEVFSLRIIGNARKYNDLIATSHKLFTNIGYLKVLWIIMLTYYKDLHTRLPPHHYKLISFSLKHKKGRALKKPIAKHT